MLAFIFKTITNKQLQFGLKSFVLSSVYIQKILKSCMNHLYLTEIVTTATVSRVYKNGDGV